MSSKLSTQQAVKKQTKRGSARTMPFEVVRFEDQPPTYEEFLVRVNSWNRSLAEKVLTFRDTTA